MVPFRKAEKRPEEIPVKNNRQFKTPTRLYILLGVVTVLLFAAAGVTMADSLLLKEQGSFFIGGRTVFTDALTGSTTGFLGTGINTGNITVDQMYVQYQIPEGADSHVPVVMVHGCCLSSKSYETTPDGRMGWNEYFLRKHRAVYLPDQVSRARSGFDATILNEIKLGKRPGTDMPEIRTATHEIAWLLFRFGPSMGKAFSDEQFPVEAFEEFGKQVIPDLNGSLPAVNPTWTNLSGLAIKLKGAVLMGHSESGFFPEQTALINPTDIKALITIETGCPALNSGSDCEPGENPDAGRLWRPPGRCPHHADDVERTIRVLRKIRRAGECRGRRRDHDAPAQVRTIRQQPHAHAGQEQQPGRRSHFEVD